MGITLHYKGRLKEAALIEPLTAEVADIAEVMNWSFYQIAHPAFDGIMLIPEGCEPLQLTVDADGKLVSGIALMHGLAPSEFLFTKTQYAGVEVHMAIVRLLRYLTEKYFADFEIVDEGGFWGSEEESASDAVRGDALRRRFGVGERAGRTAGQARDGVPGLVHRLEAVLRSRA